METLVRDADVVVHLAFVIMGSREQSRRVNIAGARNVFEAVVAAPRTVAGGAPGVYNVAGDGEVALGEVASALGGRGVRVPHAAVIAASDLLARLPRLPWQAEWIHVARAPVVMDTTKAKRELGWRPQHTSAEALAAMAAVVGD